VIDDIARDRRHRPWSEIGRRFPGRRV